MRKWGRRTERCAHVWEYAGEESHSDELDSWTNTVLRCTTCGELQQFHPLTAEKELEGRAL